MAPCWHCRFFCSLQVLFFDQTRDPAACGNRRPGRELVPRTAMRWRRGRRSSCAITSGASNSMCTACSRGSVLGNAVPGSPNREPHASYNRKDPAVLDAIPEAVLGWMMPAFRYCQSESRAVSGISRMELIGKTPETWCKNKAVLALLMRLRQQAGSSLHARASAIPPKTSQRARFRLQPSRC